jgi:hypothetical protein
MGSGYPGGESPGKEKGGDVAVAPFKLHNVFF